MSKRELLRPMFDYAAAMAAIESLKQSGKLDEAVVASFAKRGAYEEVIVALAVMCDLPVQFVERSMTRDQSENLVVLAKAIGLSSSTVNEILVLRAKKGFLAQGEIAAAAGALSIVCNPAPRKKLCGCIERVRRQIPPARSDRAVRVTSMRLVARGPFTPA